MPPSRLTAMSDSAEFDNVIALPSLSKENEFFNLPVRASQSRTLPSSQVPTIELPSEENLSDPTTASEEITRSSGRDCATATAKKATKSSARISSSPISDLLEANIKSDSGTRDSLLLDG